MGLKVIETRYASVLFRSRLEARWAAFFDKLGEKWEYEPEGFDLDGQWYLPDFWLPTFGIEWGNGRTEMGLYWEVKPTLDHIDKSRIKRFAELSEKTCIVSAGPPWDCDLIEFLPRPYIDGQILVVEYTDIWQFDETERRCAEAVRGIRFWDPPK
jgi:hypothetical protein